VGGPPGGGAISEGGTAGPVFRQRSSCCLSGGPMDHQHSTGGLEVFFPEK